MSDLIFVTGNPQKFAIAQKVFARHGIELEQGTYHVDEIQETDGDRIVRDKVCRAYEHVQSPVVVNDDTWELAGLNGFPGPYMKDVSGWFTADDFIRLMTGVADRRITLTQRIAYQDADIQEVFTLAYEGAVLPEARGTYGNSLQKVITMPGDNGKSVAEVFDAKIPDNEREVEEGWEKFIEWYDSNGK